MRTDYCASDFPLERDVEQKFLLPLLQSLGYQPEQIHCGYAVQVGRSRGRYPGADIVVKEQEKLKLVIEAKRPGESLEKAVVQGLTYAQALQIPALLVTDGLSLEVWSNSAERQAQLIWRIKVQELSQEWTRLVKLIGVGADTRWLPLLPCFSTAEPSYSQRAALAAWEQDAATLGARRCNTHRTPPHLSATQIQQRRAHQRVDPVALRRVTQKVFGIHWPA